MTKVMLGLIVGIVYLASVYIAAMGLAVGATKLAGGAPLGALRKLLLWMFLAAGGTYLAIQGVFGPLRAAAFMELSMTSALRAALLIIGSVWTMACIFLMITSSEGRRFSQAVHGRGR